LAIPICMACMGDWVTMRGPRAAQQRHVCTTAQELAATKAHNDALGTELHREGLARKACEVTSHGGGACMSLRAPS
jgi:hypothetical protein